MIKAIILDGDGVTITSTPFSKTLSEKYGTPLEDIESFFKGPFRQTSVGKADLKEIIEPYLKKWGYPGSVDEYLKEWFEYEHKINEPLIDFAKKLRQKGVKVYLATNQEKYRAEYVLNQMGFKDIFEKTYFSCHIGATKPSTEFFQKITNDLGLEKGEILFWEDKLEIVQQARDFGWRAEIYTDFLAFRDRMGRYLS